MKARDLALAATPSFLQFFNDDKRNGFAYGATFRYFHPIARFNL
jgi:hypothetical protein